MSASEHARVPAVSCCLAPVQPSLLCAEVTRDRSWVLACPLQDCSKARRRYLVESGGPRMHSGHSVKLAEVNGFDQRFAHP